MRLFLCLVLVGFVGFCCGVSVPDYGSITSFSLRSANTFWHLPSGTEKHPFGLRAKRFVSAPTNESVPLYGDVYPVAIYWFFINVGTPAVSFPVALDTGSMTLDIPYYQCDGCITRAPNTAYDESKSSTSTKVECGILRGCVDCDQTRKQCRFSNTYETCDLKDPTAPCTIKGLYFEDSVSIQQAGPVTVKFGAITEQTSNFDQFLNIDGVMGIAGAPDKSNVFETLVSQQKIGKDLFAICLNVGSKSNGTLTLGTIDPRLYIGDISYTTNIGGQEGLYEMSLTSLYLAEKQIPTNVKTIILDSGTNILLVPTPIFNSIEQIFKANCSRNPLVGVCNTAANRSLFDGVCFAITPQQMALFPNIVITLGTGSNDKVSLTVLPRDYLVVKDRQDQLCLGILKTGQNGFFIIGDTIMQEYYVVFDRTKSQIGWAQVNKKNCGSI